MLLRDVRIDGRAAPDGPPEYWTAAEWQSWRSLFESVPNRGPTPEVPDPPSAGPAIALPPPVVPSGLTVSAALERRRSRRTLGGPVPIERLSHVLRRLFRDDGTGTDSASANCGGLGELTPYLCAVDVQGLDPGLYECRGATIVPASTAADWPARIARRIGRYLGQRERTVPAAILWRVRWSVVLHRYHPGGLLTACWDAGAALQTAYLLAEEAGLAGCACAALPTEDDLAELGWLAARHAFLAAFAIGLDLTEPKT